MKLTRDHMWEVIVEHVEVENARDRERVLATYSRDNPVFEDVPSGARYVGGDEIIGNYRHLWDGFPGLSREITRWTFGDDSVVIEAGAARASRRAVPRPAAHRPPGRSAGDRPLSVRFRGTDPAGDRVLRPAHHHATARYRPRRCRRPLTAAVRMTVSVL